MNLARKSLGQCLECGGAAGWAGENGVDRGSLLVDSTWGRVLALHEPAIWHGHGARHQMEAAQLCDIAACSFCSLVCPGEAGYEFEDSCFPGGSSSVLAQPSTDLWNSFLLKHNGSLVSAFT